VPQVAKKHSVSAQTIYGWRKHFGSLEPADEKRLGAAEAQLGADRDLKLQVLQEISRRKW
jgi:putative transposase